MNQVNKMSGYLDKIDEFFLIVFCIVKPFEMIERCNVSITILERHHQVLMTLVKTGEVHSLKSIEYPFYY